MFYSYKVNCLRVNGAQSVKLEKGIIEFKNYCRQTHCPFKVYCDFECNLGEMKFMKVVTQKNTIIIFLVVCLQSFLCWW